MYTPGEYTATTAQTARPVVQRAARTGAAGLAVSAIGRLTTHHISQTDQVVFKKLGDQVG